MKLIKTPINDLFILEPKIFGDPRGWFMESYHQSKFAEIGISCSFVQDNLSCSCQGTLRGLHFQKKSFAQAKLVTCLRGEVYDVAVDLRINSPTFGQHFGILLNDINKYCLMIPRGFAHGFYVTSSEALFFYKCDQFYHPEHEAGFRYDDTFLNISWPIIPGKVIVSNKDLKLPNFSKDLCEF